MNGRLSRREALASFPAGAKTLEDAANRKILERDQRDLRK